MAQIENVDVATARHLVAAGALLLDVREEYEWEAGHAPTARHIALAAVPDHVDDLPRQRIIICVCRSGGRSARAGQFLLEEGFDAVNLEGGMTAWHAAGAEMVADTAQPTVA